LAEEVTTLQRALDDVTEGATREREAYMRELKKLEGSSLVFHEGHKHEAERIAGLVQVGRLGVIVFNLVQVTVGDQVSNGPLVVEEFEESAGGPGWPC
jgi:hypothetical protein